MRKKVLTATAVAVIVVEILMVLFIIMLMQGEKTETGFNELYFVGEIPKDIELGTETGFSFAVANRQDSVMTYHYIVYVNKEQINRGVVQLNPEEIAVINKSFEIRRVFSDIDLPVQVRLLDTNDEIHFWTHVSSVQKE